jgi:TPR repeat protein
MKMVYSSLFKQLFKSFSIDIGEGIEKNATKAGRWYQKASNMGDAFAQYNLGRSYINGINGLPKDEKMAFDWFHKSALQGVADSMANLAAAYAEGIPNQNSRKLSKLCV